nr:integrase, catalytic region, zinc finger, CCHC-type, peptidase aspartic, catalytic [Tanacetum cinerariifolium]
QKLENANVELEFQVFNYAKENAHLKATYKNLFDSISVSRVQTETKIDSLQNELQCNIYKNAKLRTQLFKKVSDQKENTLDSSKNTKFAKQPIVEILPKIGETNALSKPITSNYIPKPPVSKGVNNAKVIAPDMFRISPNKVSREAKKVPNTVSTSSRTKPITTSQPSVITKKGMNSNSNGLSSTGLDNTKTRRPQHRSNTKDDRVPSASKSSRIKNKEAEVEEHHRNLLLSKNNKHMSSACNNSKFDSPDVITKVVCAMCKKCLNSVNHDVCLKNSVNGKKSHGRKHKANVSKSETQQKNQPEIKKPKNVGPRERLATSKPRKPRFLLRKHKANVSINETQKEYRPKVSKSKNVRPRESLATPKPRKPRYLLRWSPTGKMFDSAGKLVAPSGDNACTSNALEPKIKRFPNSTSLLGRLSRFVCGASTQWGNILITRVYFVEGLGHNLFSVGQFCDLDLEVAFRRNACFVRNLDGVDLLKDDYSRYTWVHFLRLKDEAPEVIIKFLKRITVLLQSPVIIIRTDNGT